MTNSVPGTTQESAPPTSRDRLERALLAPVRALRPAYVPLLMVYFAYGALGLTAIAETFWVKKALTLTPADLAELGVWLSLPWTVKMVFGEIVDSIPILGSQRRVYVMIGAALVATSFVLLAGAAGGWIGFASLETLYVTASLMTVAGVVLQDVVADAMSTEVVPRMNPDGSPRQTADINHDLGMVQVLGRLALAFGIVATAGLAGWLASTYSYETVFLLGLAIPAISVAGVFLVRLDTPERRPADWRILGGGLAFGAVVAALALLDVPFNQEIVFLISLGVIGAMLVRVTSELDETTRKQIAYAALLIFAFRATPSVGEGYTWFSMDRLGFDEAFFGTLGVTGAAVALVATWLFSDTITRQPIAKVLLWLTLLGAVLSLPNLMLVFGVHEWTEAAFGFGARSIALVDSAAESPLIQLSMIPLLTLIAIHAPAGHRATWFALMASLMNLALVAGNLETKALNEMFIVERGNYAALPMLTVIAVALAAAIPLAAIWLLGRRVDAAGPPGVSPRARPS